MIKIIYEDNHILVVEKPVNMLVQADDTQDMDLLTLLKEDLKKRYNKPGNVYLGLVHRLDRPVGGVMVFARTSKAASRLSEQIRTNSIKKTYRAIIMGIPNKKEDIFKDKLLKDPKTNMVIVSDKGKDSELSYKVLKTKDKMSLVEINLKTGRSHQIRVQFASRGLPLYGDQRYNKNAVVGEQIALFATKLEFIHPVTKEAMSFTSVPNNVYPWDIF